VERLLVLSQKNGRNAELRHSQNQPTYYTFVIVKFPLPVQAEVVPTRAQVPVIVPPFTVPVKFSAALLPFPEVAVNRNLPDTFPLKFPLSTNEPVSLACEIEQLGSFVVKVKLLTVNDPLLVFSDNEVVNANTGLLFESVSAAVQFPLTLPELLLPDPQPSAIPANTKTAAARIFIEATFSCWNIPASSMGYESRFPDCKPPYIPAGLGSTKHVQRRMFNDAL